MKFFYKYGNEDWALLPVAYKQWSNITSMISKSTASNVPIDRTYYELLRSGIGPVADIDEDFEDLGPADTDIVAASGDWSNIISGANRSFLSKAYGGGLAGYFNDNDAGNAYQIRYTFPTASPLIPGEYKIVFKHKPDGAQNTYVHIGDAVGSTRIRLWFHPTAGRLYTYESGGATLISENIWADAVEIIIEIITIDDDHHDISVTVDGSRTLYNNGGAHWENNGQFTGAITRMDIYTGVATTPKFYIEDIQCSWTTEVVGWDKNNENIRFMKVIACKDAITADNLNTDFDATEKIWLGKLTNIIHGSSRAILQLEQWHAQFLREVIEENNNVVETVYIKSFLTARDTIECVTTIEGAVSPAWVGNEHAGRGCRIIARDGEKIERFCPSNDAITPEKALDNYSENYAALDNLMDSKDIAINAYNALEVDEDTASFYIEFEVSVKRHPKIDGVLNIVFYVKWRRQGAGDDAWVTDYYPSIYLYNFTDAVYELVASLSDASPLQDYWDNSPAQRFSINITSSNMKNYYDTTNELIKIKIDSGCYDEGGANPYSGTIEMRTLRAFVQMYEDHEPKEFKIVVSDVLSDDDLELEVDSGTYDTITEFLNYGDTVKILYQNKEWLEEQINDQALDLNAIEMPSTFTVPTFTVMNDKQIYLNINEILEHEKWEYYTTRKTYNGKPKLIGFEKSSPPDYGLSIWPENLHGTDIQYGINYLDKVRQVKVRNKTNLGVYPASAPLSNFPVAAITRKDLPTSYLEIVAQALYEQRDSIEPDLMARIYSLMITDENFERYILGQKITDVSTYWSPLAGDNENGTSITYFITHKTALHGYNWLKLHDFSGVANIELKQMLLSVNPDNDAGSMTFEIFPEDPGAGINMWANIILNEGGDAAGNIRIHLTFRLETGHVWYFDGTNHDTGLILNIDQINELIITQTSTTKFSLTLNGTTVTNLNNENAVITGIDRVHYTTIVANSGDLNFWINFMYTSWNDGGFHNIQDVPSTKFHEGATMSIHGIPSLKGGIDYTVNEYIVIRELNWGTDKSTEIKLGYAEASRRSIAEIIQEAIIRTRHEVIE